MIVLCCVLVNCTSALERAGHDLENDITVCTEGELTRENVWQRRNCFDQAFLTRMRQGGYTHMDWVDQLIANNRIAAAAFYQGKLSKDEYGAIAARNISYFNELNDQARNAESARDDCVVQTRALSGLCALARSEASSCYSEIMANAVRQCGS